MKTLIHTDKEQIESIIRQSDVCFVGMADTRWNALCIADEFRL